MLEIENGKDPEKLLKSGFDNNRDKVDKWTEK